MKMSFGHFNSTFPSSVPPKSTTTPATASRTASPAIICNHPLTDVSRTIEAGTLVTKETMNDSPFTLTHRWSSRPRPAVCSSAHIATISWPVQSRMPNPSALLYFPEPNKRPSRNCSAA